MPSLNLIGAGRLGKSLAYLAQVSGQYQIAGIFSRSAASSIAAREFIGAGQVFDQWVQLPPADLWLIAVPDGALANVADELTRSGVVNAGAVVFHASGALAAEQLTPLVAQGALTASLHPAFSFADPARAVATFAGTLCALEGDAGACETLTRFAQAIGGVPFQLQGGKDAKVAYHAALSMASNYLVSLSHLALQTASQAGISPERANQLVLGLMRQTLANIEQLGPAAALTGPIVRGDAATVAQHVQHLAAPVLPSYRALGLATVALSGERLSEAQRKALLDVLS